MRSSVVKKVEGVYKQNAIVKTNNRKSHLQSVPELDFCY